MRQLQEQGPGMGRQTALGSFHSSPVGDLTKTALVPGRFIIPLHLFFQYIFTS